MAHRTVTYNHEELLIDFPELAKNFHELIHSDMPRYVSHRNRYLGKQIDRRTGRPKKIALDTIIEALKNHGHEITITVNRITPLKRKPPKKKKPKPKRQRPSQAQFLKDMGIDLELIKAIQLPS